MLRRNALILFFALAVLATLTGCKGFFVGGDTLQTITLSPGATITAPGTNVTFTANGTTVDGNPKDVTSTATWSSSDNTVATVSKGTVTPLKVGTATITASADGVDATVVVTVLVSTLTTLNVTPSPATGNLSLGTNTLQFTATGTLSDGSSTNLTGNVTWSSSNTSIATINSSGLASLVATGTSTITATVNAAGTSKQGTSTLTVQ